MPPALVANAVPTSTGATDADSENGRAAQNQRHKAGLGGGHGRCVKETVSVWP